MDPENERVGSEINVQPRRLSARLRPLMPEIDRLVRDGVTHEDVMAGLAERGIVVSRGTFRKNLYRYRRKVAAEPAKLDTNETPTQGGEPMRATEEVASAPPPKAAPDPLPPAKSPSFEEIMDPKKRDVFADQYMTSPRRRIGLKKES